MTGPRGFELEEASPPHETRQTSYFDRWDLVLVVGVTAVGFILRFFSPILPSIFVHPLSGPIVTNCVSNTPIDPVGDPGTLCGLSYPFNRGYPDANGVLSPPNGQVFDEIYFPVDAYNDVKGIEQCRPASTYCRYSYFDPEPPLAKELIAVGEVGYGWWRAHFQGARGDYVDLGFNTFGWRIAACIFGTLCIPMMYLFARRLWPKRLFAFAAAVLVCFDGMFFIQSRIGMIDIFPIFFILAAYFAFMVHMQSRTASASLVSLVALGVVLGIGIASKWIVLAAWASIVFFIFMRAVLYTTDFHVGPPGRSLLSWRRGEMTAIAGGAFWPSYLAVAILALAVIPLAIYVMSWYPFFARGQFHNLTDLINYQVQSYRYHATLTATHPYGSPWGSWPFLARPVLYYAEYTNLGIDKFTGQPLISRISDLGNPWIWWTSLPCLVSLPYFVIRYKSFPAAVIAVGFLTQYLPWAPITRVLFLYHMFGGLIFMVLALAFVLTQLSERVRWRRPKMIVFAHLAVAIVFFAYFYPVWTGAPISQSAFFEESGTPPWGPKIWLVNCRNDLLPGQPQLFCWN